MNSSLPKIIAHRGAAGEAPENTLASFELGLEQGCDAFELDIHLSKDGEIVVIHDYTIDRTTDGTGAVQDLTLDELRKWDAGSWFDAKYTGQRIPTLREVFELAPKDLIINVEIKGGLDAGIEQKLVSLMREYDRIETVVVSSFHFDSLQRLQDLNSSIKLGLLYHQDFQHHEHLPAAVGVDTYSLHPYFKQLTTSKLAAALENGLQVYPWTVNEAEDMKRMIELGSSGIITDYPGRLKQVLAELTANNI
ncbi:glycerophosphodiester phosphodiesterase [Neobacillus mesonae]|nr:glycerophosphodiester phosphodiesterase [Neobacillus mesonae]